MPSSCGASEAAWLLKPEISRWLQCWWAALHVLLLCAVVAADNRVWTWLGASAAIAAHWRLRRPAPVDLILYSPQGGWSLPARGEHGLRLGPRSRATPLAVRLELEGPGGASEVLLLRDQLDAEGWRRLQIAVRASLSRRS